MEALPIIAVIVIAAVVGIAILLTISANKIEEEHKRIGEGPVLTRKELVQYDRQILFPLDDERKIILWEAGYRPGSLSQKTKLLHVDDEFYQYASWKSWDWWSGKVHFRFDLVDFDDWLNKRAAKESRREQLRKKFGSN